MIVVKGADALRPSPEELLDWLLSHPALAAAAAEFKAIPVMRIGESDSSRVVCVLQKEFATADPQFVEFIGTDGVTTCVALGLRNPESGLTSVGHLDSVNCVREGVAQMLASLLPDGDTETLLEVHLAGAFDDSDDEGAANRIGHSWPLCVELIQVLHSAPQKLDIRTFCILQHNTIKGTQDHPSPIVRGVLIEAASGRCLPAQFSMESRGPDVVVRELSLFAGPQSKLRNPYDTLSDSFSIQPVKWSRKWKSFAEYSLTMSDEDLLHSRSTSPHAESPDFVASIRRLDAYLFNYPNWEDTFPEEQARRFVRSSSKSWIRKA